MKRVKYPKVPKMPQGFVLERTLGRLAKNVQTGYEGWTDAQLNRRAREFSYELRLVDEEMVRRQEKREESAS